MCRDATFKQTFFLVYVFNKILIIFLAKLACLSLWTQCSSAHTCKEGQGQQRSCKAHLGVKKWVFWHLLHTYWGAGFWFGTTQQRAKAKQTWRALFQCQGEQQTANGELLGQSICMGKWRRPGCLPCLGHCSGHTELAAASATAFRAAVLAGTTLPGIPGETFVPDCLCSVVPLLPTAALLLLSPLWDHPWPLYFVATLRIPRDLCLSTHTTIL